MDEAGEADYVSEMGEKERGRKTVYVSDVVGVC